MGFLDAALNFGARAVQLGDKSTQGQAAAKTAQTPAAEPAKSPTSMSDDNVTLDAEAARRNRGFDLPIKDYKSAVATDADFVRDTLKTKLSELELDPDTHLSVRKNSMGEMELDTRLPPEQRERIENDLNQNRAFKAAFDRLSVNQPTLNYLDNVSRLSQAYGTSNNLFETLVSEREENNNLQDIAHRYDEMRKQVEKASAQAESQTRDYAVRVNAQA